MTTKLASALSDIGREALRIVLPSWCVACGRDLPWKDRTASCCASCWSSLPKITTAKCQSCALPLPVKGAGGRAEGAEERPEPAVPLVASFPAPCALRPAPSDTPLPSASWLCAPCAAHPLPLDWCDAWGRYQGGLERLLGALKFERHDFLDDALASLLEETLLARGDVGFDGIVPIPMVPAKERRRGYNQAGLLAAALSKRTGIALDRTLLVPRGARARQASLPKRQRATNVRGAFAASADVAGRAILLVDDITTTGETFRAAAAVLQKAGAARVAALAVAKAL